MLYIYKIRRSLKFLYALQPKKTYNYTVLLINLVLVLKVLLIILRMFLLLLNVCRKTCFYNRVSTKKTRTFETFSTVKTSGTRRSLAAITRWQKLSSSSSQVFLNPSSRCGTSTIASGAWKEALRSSKKTCWMLVAVLCRFIF